MRRSKWWGWGDADKSYHIPDPERFWGFVRSRLGPTVSNPPVESLERCELRPSRLPASMLAAVGNVVGNSAVLTSKTERAAYSLGKSYRDLVRIRAADVPNPTDAIVQPRNSEQVRALLDVAARERVSVIPFGGGTSVVGGVEPESDGPVLTVDMGLLSDVVQIDPVSATAVVEAGIFGPDLERQLNEAGFTLGHFPQSFEFSTLGGWLATRSAGQNSSLYGRIEDRVEALRLAYPGGQLTTPEVPAAAAGPDLVQLVCGSEGSLGIITEAKMRLARLPAVRDYRGYAFESFGEGVAAARELMQRGFHPAMIRLSDEAETESTLAMRPPPKGIGSVVESAGRWYMARRGIRLESAAIMILGFEGEKVSVDHQWSEAKRVLKGYSAFSLGGGAGRAWQASRFEAPYLRDLLLDHGILVDTLETSTTWDNYESLHAAVRDALSRALGERCVVMAHLSHSYSDGGSIYYTFLAPQERGREVEQWERAKVAATDAIVQHGGALSHHHGIGSEHLPWMESYIGSEGMQVLASLKAALDPAGVMNPGKLLPRSQDASRG